MLEHRPAGKAFHMDRALDGAATGPRWLQYERVAQVVAGALRYGERHLSLCQLQAWGPDGQPCSHFDLSGSPAVEDRQCHLCASWPGGLSHLTKGLSENNCHTVSGTGENPA